jgi:hypothetical protein
MNMSKVIEVKLTIEVPDNASNKDVKDWIDVELCHWNSMKRDNPCIEGAFVIDMEWSD